MSRLATIAALPAALALLLTASPADAGWTKNINLNKGIHLAKNIAQQHGVRLPVKPPVGIRPPQPPIGAPPVIIRPPVRPPVLPVHPPIIHPPIKPCPPKPPVCPPIIHPPIQPIEPPAPTTAFRPISFPSPVQPAVVPTRTWYFGMSLEITNTMYGRGLRVASVTPGAPAALSGLERGDVLIVANGQTLQHASTNEHGVQILQSLVEPTQGSIQFGVLDIRTNQPTYLTVTPQRLGGAPAPTAAPAGAFPAFPAAPVASNAAPAQAF